LSDLGFLENYQCVLVRSRGYDNDVQRRSLAMQYDHKTLSFGLNFDDHVEVEHVDKTL
jgi:Fe2+ transport system protein FeoA